MTSPIYLLIPFLFTGVGCSCQDRNDRRIFLWSVEDPWRRTKAYLFGTIHVPYTAVWDKVSERVKEAFEQSDTAAFEVDLHDEATLKKLVRCKNLKKRQNVQSYLPAPMYKRLHKVMRNIQDRIMATITRKADSENDLFEKEMEAARIHTALIGGWERKRPEWLLFMLYQLCDTTTASKEGGPQSARPPDDSPVLDLYLAEKALAGGKQMHAIESAEEQCNPISTVSQEQVLFAINYTIAYLERGQDDAPKRDRTVMELLHEYRCGQLEDTTIRKENRRDLSSLDEMEQEIEDQLREDIMISRNERMAKRLRSLIDDHPDKKLFAALGTGHFLGDRSILQHLGSMGMIVTEVKEEDFIAWPNARHHRPNTLWVRSRDGRGDASMQVLIELSSSEPKPSAARLPFVTHLFLLILVTKLLT